MRGLAVPSHIAQEIAEFRYRERFKLSHNELMDEPADEISKALMIWKLDQDRAEVEAKRNN